MFKTFLWNKCLGYNVSCYVHTFYWIHLFEGLVRYKRDEATKRKMSSHLKDEEQECMKHEEQLL